MDPATMMSGAPSFQGGDAAPSMAESKGGTVNAWMASPFSVGSGAMSSASAPVSTSPYGMVGMDGPAASLGLGGISTGVDMLPIALAGVALLVAVIAIKRH